MVHEESSWKVVGVEMMVCWFRVAVDVGNEPFAGHAWGRETCQSWWAGGSCSYDKLVCVGVACPMAKGVPHVGNGHAEARVVAWAGDRLAMWESWSAMSAWMLLRGRNHEETAASWGLASVWLWCEAWLAIGPGLVQKIGPLLGPKMHGPWAKQSNICNKR